MTLTELALVTPYGFDVARSRADSYVVSPTGIAYSLLAVQAYGRLMAALEPEACDANERESEFETCALALRVMHKLGYILIAINRHQTAPRIWLPESPCTEKVLATTVSLLFRHYEIRQANHVLVNGLPPTRILEHVLADAAKHRVTGAGL